MASIWNFGDPPYGFEDLKIATNDLDGTFGTTYDVPSAQMLRGQLTLQEAELEGDDTITAIASKVIKGEGAFRFGGMPFEVFSVITGQAIASSGAGSAAYRFIDFANANMPYFGLCGRADAGEGSGDTHLFFPKCKVAGNFEVKLEGNAFSIPEIPIKMIGDDNFLDANGRKIVVRAIQHASAEVVTLPPTYA